MKWLRVADRNMWMKVERIISIWPEANPYLLQNWKIRTRVRNSLLPMIYRGNDTSAVCVCTFINFRRGLTSYGWINSWSKLHVLIRSWFLCRAGTVSTDYWLINPSELSGTNNLKIVIWTVIIFMKSDRYRILLSSRFITRHLHTLQLVYTIFNTLAVEISNGLRTEGCDTRSHRFLFSSVLHRILHCTSGTINNWGTQSCIWRTATGWII